MARASEFIACAFPYDRVSNFEVQHAGSAPRRRVGFGLRGALVVWPLLPNSRGLIKLLQAIACT